MRAASRAAQKRAEQAAADERGRRADAALRARRLARQNADAMPVVEAVEGPRVERYVDKPLVPPSPRGGIVEVLQQPYLLRLIVTRQLAAQYAASILGLLWSYIQPAMRFGVYYVALGVVIGLHSSVPSYAIHLFCGIVFIHYFSETWSGGTRSIWQNRQLVMKMRMPRETFPVAAMVVAAYHTFPQVLLLVVICVLTGWHLSVAGVAAGLLGIAILVLFSMAMALFFSALNVFYRDFQNIVGTVMQFMHFMVPMMYTYSRIAQVQGSHPWVYQAYMANPVAEAVLLLQRCFWWDVVPPSQRHGAFLVSQGQHLREFPADLWLRGLVILVVSGLLLYGAQRFFSRAESKFPERM